MVMWCSVCEYLIQTIAGYTCPDSLYAWLNVFFFLLIQIKSIYIAQWVK